MKSKKIMAFLTTLTLLSMLVFGTISVNAADNVFTILPAERYARTGNYLTHRIECFNVTTMNSWAVNITWDPTYLAMWREPIAGDALSYPGYNTTSDPDTGIPVYSNGSGWLKVSDALQGDNENDNVTIGADGRVMVMFYLTVIADPPLKTAGGTPIDITEAVYYDSYGNPTTPSVNNAKIYLSYGVTTIEWLTHWTSVDELKYWELAIEDFNVEYPEINVILTGVEFTSLHPTIMTRKAAGQMPDLIHMHAMWVPEFADNEMLSIPPAEVQQDVTDNWGGAPKDGSTYMHTIWGYPTEYNTWALVYNKKILEKVALTNATVADALDTLNSGGTLTWGIPSIGKGELEKVAEACTQYNELDEMNVSGFVPYQPASPEECRFIFMSLLWSNGGEMIDFTTPEALFNSAKGKQVLELYKWTSENTYDPVEPFPGDRMGWDSWVPPDYEIALWITPTWFTYIRDAMGWEDLANPGEFTNETLGIAPMPIGPSGTPPSVSLQYSWIATVTKAAEGRTDPDQTITHAEAAWTFLKWINEPREDAAPYGFQPDAHDVSRMGDYLIYDSIIPSRISDYENSPICEDLFWFKGFIDIAKTYGRADTYFRTSDLVQAELYTDLFAPILLGPEPRADPSTTADAVADSVTGELPIPGDLVPDNIIDIFDVGTVAVAFGAVPGDDNWNPRADPMPDYNLVDIFDIAVCAVNFGRYNDLYEG